MNLTASSDQIRPSSKSYILLSTLLSYIAFLYLGKMKNDRHSPPHRLTALLLLTSPSVTTEQANKDFKRECVLLNDVPFIPDNDDPDRCHAFSFTVTLLLERLLHHRSNIADQCVYPSSRELTDMVMQRACRTSAGADSFFMIQKLLCVEGTC